MSLALPREIDERHRIYLREALGFAIGEALADPDITEVMVNADGSVWLDTLAAGLVRTAHTLEPNETAAVLDVVAGLLDTLLDSKHPILEGEIPYDGSRIEGVVPPVSRAPVLTVRKPASCVYPLSDYVNLASEVVLGSPTPPPSRGYEETIRWALAERRNILVTGGTSSAKTSFLNSLFQSLLDLDLGQERLFLIEDTFELQCPTPNRVELQTNDRVSLARLVRVALRMRPDRIVVGEVRGPEALPMLKAWNTGHDGGFATVHANSAKEALYRLEELIAEAGGPPQPKLIARSIDLVVFLRRVSPRARVVSEVLHVLGHDGADYETRNVDR